MVVGQSPEVDLVCRARDGDAEAFGDLVRMYHKRAVSLAFRLLGNSADAADVSQDAFLRAFCSLPQLEDASRFGGWLMRVVANLSLNYRRSRASRFAGSLDDGSELWADARRPATRRNVSASGEAEALPDELHDAVSAALERLPEGQRLALILFSVEGVPQREVADILECSVELVKWNVFQARKKLAAMLKDHL